MQNKLNELQDICPLCQAVLSPACSACSPVCPVSKSCSTIKCQNCGYRFPLPRGFSAWIARLLTRNRKQSNSKMAEVASLQAGDDDKKATTLADAPQSSPLRVIGLQGPPSRLSKLASFGMVEGCEIRIRQKVPSFIVDIGETTLALDGGLARAVRVEAVAKQ